MVSGDHEGLLGYHSAVTDDFVFQNAEGVRLGQIVSAIKKHFQYLEPGKIELDYITIFVRNAIEVMEGDEEEVERRTQVRHGDV